MYIYIIYLLYIHIIYIYIIYIYIYIYIYISRIFTSTKTVDETINRTQVRYNQALYNQTLKKEKIYIYIYVHIYVKKYKCCWSKKALNKMFRGSEIANGQPYDFFIDI